MTVFKLWFQYRHLFLGNSTKLRLVRLHNAFSTSSLPHYDKHAGSRIPRKFRRHSSKSTPHKYISVESTSQLIQKGELLQGKLCVLSPTCAYVEHPLDGSRIIIDNYSPDKFRDKDFVAVRLNPIKLWKVWDKSEPKKIYFTDQDLLVENEPSDVDEPVTLDSTLNSITLEDNDEPLVTPVQPSSSMREILKPSPSEVFINRKVLTVEQLMANLQDYPIDPDLISLVTRLDLEQIPNAMTVLPHPDLIRSGSLVKVLKRIDENQRLLGSIAFYPFWKKNITRSTTQSHDPIPFDRCICMFIPHSANQKLVKLDPWSVPKEAWMDWKLGLNKTYICQITGWDQRAHTLQGVLCEHLGDSNDLASETKRILTEFGIRDENFTSSHLDGLPFEPDEFEIPSIEYRRRKDFRSCCVFTIDPATAKDFDDALHVKKLSAGLYEVGIHIADVSYFVRPHSALDKEASERTTSVYLVEKVIPMLPSILSEHLCSLVPHQDRLAFSVVLNVKESGEIVNEWFGRTLIRSRARLTYDHAWSLIQAVESGADSNALNDLYKLLPNPEPPFTMNHIQESIMILHKIAQNIRKTRIENGALVLRKAELQFNLPTSCSTSNNADSNEDPNNDLKVSSVDNTIWPRSFSVKVGNPSHELIEEWMIAANQAVARQLFSHFAKYRLSESSQNSSISQLVREKMKWIGGLLRRHPQPEKTKLNEVVTIARAANIDMDISSSSALTKSMDKVLVDLRTQGCNPTQYASITGALSYLIYFRLQLAIYFSLDDSARLLKSSPQTSKYLANIPNSLIELRTLDHKPSSDDDPKSIFDYTWHYGLSIPLYTHFTSPIRRYADLLVHRELASLLGCSDWTYSMRTEGSSNDKRTMKLLRELVESFRNQSDMQQEQTNLSLSQLSLLAAWCNDRRIKARRASEASQRLFLTACIRDCGPVVENAIIVDLNRKFIKVLVTAFGIVLDIRLKSFLSNASHWKYVGPLSAPSEDNISQKSTSSESNGMPTIKVYWDEESEPSTTETTDSTVQLRVFSIIQCQLSCSPTKLNLLAHLYRTSTASSILTDTTSTITTNDVQKTV